ncbi:hypothetical protein Aduo_005519 [Ancylostoma duodenale]
MEISRSIVRAAFAAADEHRHKNGNGSEMNTVFACYGLFTHPQNPAASSAHPTSALAHYDSLTSYDDVPSGEEAHVCVLRNRRRAAFDEDLHVVHVQATSAEWF